MEFDPTASPSFNAEAARWSTTCTRPSLPHRYSVRSPKWHSLADAAETMSSAFLACNHFVFDARAFVRASGVNASKFPKPEVVLQGPCQAVCVTRLFVVGALLPRRCFTGDLFFLF